MPTNLNGTRSTFARYFPWMKSKLILINLEKSYSACKQEYEKQYESNAIHGDFSIQNCIAQNYGEFKPTSEALIHWQTDMKEKFGLKGNHILLNNKQIENASKLKQSQTH